jgi:hypothetical protein
MRSHYRIGLIRTPYYRAEELVYDRGNNVEVAVAAVSVVGCRGNFALSRSLFGALRSGRAAGKELSHTNRSASSDATNFSARAVYVHIYAVH